MRSKSRLTPNHWVAFRTHKNGKKVNTVGHLFSTGCRNKNKKEETKKKVTKDDLKIEENYTTIASNGILVLRSVLELTMSVQ